MNRGDVVLVRFPHPSGGRGKKQPVVIVQADSYNASLRSVVVAEVTTNLSLATDPACLFIDVGTTEGKATGLLGNSVVSALLLATVDVDRLDRTIGLLSDGMNMPKRRLVAFLLVAGPSLLALTAYLLLRPGKEELPARRQVDAHRILVDRAVDKGVAYLQSLDWGLAESAGENVDEVRQEAVGTAALAGLAFMVRETPQSSDVIRRIRTLVLKAAPTLTRTEPVCWSIIFLKRRGEPVDDQVIATLTLRLAACQYPNGCWAEEVAVLIPQQEELWTRWYGHRKDQSD